MEESLSDYTTSIQEKRQEVNQLKKEISDIKTFKRDAKRIQKLNKDREKLEEELTNLTEEKDKKQIEFEDLTYWEHKFGIEANVNYFLNKFRVNILVKIEGYTKLKSGEVRDKINVTVSRDSEHWAKFVNLSGGQRARLNACAVFTFQHFINNASKYGGLDFLSMDEFLEGLDRRGQKMALNLLDSAGATTLVISHNNNDVAWNHKLVVEYKNEISKLI